MNKPNETNEAKQQNITNEATNPTNPTNHHAKTKKQRHTNKRRNLPTQPGQDPRTKPPHMRMVRQTHQQKTQIPTPTKPNRRPHQPRSQRRKQQRQTPTHAPQMQPTKTHLNTHGQQQPHPTLVTQPHHHQHPGGQTPRSIGPTGTAFGVNIPPGGFYAGLVGCFVGYFAMWFLFWAHIL